MLDFVPGQRWINDAELQLGLGTVMSVEHRRVTLVFFSTGETRIYAINNAPLTRVRFSAGDSIRCHDGQSILVTEVLEQNGIIEYRGKDSSGATVSVNEAQLDNFIQLNKPGERLFSGQIDPTKQFELRYQSLLASDRLSHSRLRGLNGCRTSLIPHQLYIAHEVANRYAPRVLLADEVGLGKTIEAGLIVHQQLLSERAARVLILVPDSLVHQWLVEMLRRFNLRFSLFNAERFQAAAEPAESPDNPTDSFDKNVPENPFLEEQLVLCSLDYLCQDPLLQQQSLAGEWDLLVVDEAHHLAWSPESVSEEYQLVEQLAAVTQGILLLTATPEQLGKTGHFARLRLLDPDRFPDYQKFAAQEQDYRIVAEAMDGLLENARIAPQTAQILAASLGEKDNNALLAVLKDDKAPETERERAKTELIEHLLDRHGTGRVLFRNSRAAISGFPARQALAYPLAAPEQYLCAEVANPADSLYPEQRFAANGDDWTRFDPRLGWLIELLKTHKTEKFLVICAKAQTVLAISEAIRVASGIYAAVFHQGMSIIERDKAAAYFADADYGAQLLVCSEIGSEGRNFQFAHHLVMFDLPYNPDLLEQRIGRLDRIGQTHPIRIHLPYLQGTAQEILFRWYHQGLDAFEHQCPAAHALFSEFHQALDELLVRPANESSVAQQAERLIAATKKRAAILNRSLQQGRDRLLEYNSCRPGIANSLYSEAVAEDAKDDLQQYMELLFDCLGIDSDSQGEHIFLARPSESLLTPLAELPDDGLSLTYHRATALANEDLAFITWDHPLTRSAMDLVLSSEIGNTAVVAASDTGAKPGTMLLECLFIIESPNTGRLHSGRYLPATLLAIVIDEFGKPYTKLSTEFINNHCSHVDRKTAVKIVRTKQKAIATLIRACETSMAGQIGNIIKHAKDKADKTLGKEYDRLAALRQVNPNIRASELAYYQEQMQQVRQILDSLMLRLDAVRVLVAL